MPTASNVSHVALFTPKKATVLRKHVATVHSSAPLTAKERVTVNVLLANAISKQDESVDVGPRHRQHTIELSQLSQKLFNQQRSIKRLRRVLNGLLTKIVQWNYIDEDSSERWGASTWLAGYEIKDQTLYYSYSIEILEKILDPQVFARINYSIQHWLTRRQSLALYENCARYRDIGKTRAWTLDTFRGLMGVEGRYPEFKILNRDVIKPSVAEINEKTEIFIGPVLKKRSHEILAIQFIVEENTGYDGPSMPSLLAASLDDSLIEGRVEVYEACLSFGIDRRQTMLILDQYDDQYILDNLLIVAERIRMGRTKVRRPAALAVNALREDYRSPIVDYEKVAGMSNKAEKLERQAIEESKAARAKLSDFENNQFPRWRFKCWQNSASQAQKDRAWDAFYKQEVATNTMLMRLYRADSTNAIVYAQWRVFVRNECMPLPDDEDRIRCANAIGLPLDEIRQKARIGES